MGARLQADSVAQTADRRGAYLPVLSAWRSFKHTPEDDPPNRYACRPCRSTRYPGVPHSTEEAALKEKEGARVCVCVCLGVWWWCVCGKGGGGGIPKVSARCRRVRLVWSRCMRHAAIPTCLRIRCMLHVVCIRRATTPTPLLMHTICIRERVRPLQQ